MAVEIQERLGIDVLVHGEPERNDMVEYFGEQLSGFATTANGWVQTYGSCCVRPPIIYGDVSRPYPMTLFWSLTAQNMTLCPMKGVLTGPVTILNWSFVRNDQPRFKTCYQIALAIKEEVEDLEYRGIQVIQIDEAALREGLPLRKSEHASYLDWAAQSFRITNCGVKDTTQVIYLEDVHSLKIPDMEEFANQVRKMLAVLDTNILWVNPNCGFKTCTYGDVVPALSNMVDAVKLIRAQLN